MAKAKDKGLKIGKGAKGTRAEKLSSVIAGAAKEYGKAIMLSPGEESLLVVPRVSTGLYGLDVATNGGLPVGRVTMVYGENGTGKTMLFLRSLANAQMLCANCYGPGVFVEGKMDLPNFKTGKVESVKTMVIESCPCGNPRDMVVLWIDAENVWETSWTNKMGVRPEKVILVKPSYGEQAYDVISAFVSTKEIDLICIDSLAQLTPRDEYNAAMGEQFQGVAARMNNRFLRRLVGGMNDAFTEGRPITFWMVNQYREKIGVMFGSNLTLPGGKGQQFATSLEIETRKKKIEMDDDTDEPLIGNFAWTVKKNKVGVPGGKGEYQMCLTETDLFGVGDLMEHEAVIAKAVDLEFIEHPTTITYEFGGQKFRGKSPLVRYLGEHPDEYEDLKLNMLCTKLGIARDEKAT